VTRIDSATTFAPIETLPIEKGEEERGRGEARGGSRYRDGGVDALDVALLDEDLHGLEAERLDLRLRQRLAPLELLDLPVQIRRPHGPPSSFEKLLEARRAPRPPPIPAASGRF
jgi:hypothetical protein